MFQNIFTQKQDRNYMDKIKKFRIHWREQMRSLSEPVQDFRPLPDLPMQENLIKFFKALLG